MSGILAGPLGGAGSGGDVIVTPDLAIGLVAVTVTEPATITATVTEPTISVSILPASIVTVVD